MRIKRRAFQLAMYAWAGTVALALAPLEVQHGTTRLAAPGLSG